jgi:hypothetical protein
MTGTSMVMADGVSEELSPGGEASLDVVSMPN